MSQSVDATFDGEVFRPTETVSLEPNTRVRLIIVKKPSSDKEPQSFLDVARSQHLKGPADWSTNLDDYLYHGKKMPDDE
jgi:hypothetical protein